MSSPAPARRRNPRGQGGLLRDNIVAAAAEILEETCNEDAVSLRAVARRIGITAPAIYGHFADREAVLAAVVADAFVDLFEAVTTAGQGHSDPVLRLRATAAGYLKFADERPGRFRLLFGRRRNLTAGIPQAESVRDMVGADAFGTLIEGIERCVAAGCSASTDPERDATQLWIGLHGYATLRTSVPYFPWPPQDELLDDLIRRAAFIDVDGARRPG
jgi:AcrR family transcriptional regulator